MSLIKCPECKKEISDKAKSCPNCGCPININTKYQVIITGYHDTDTSAYAGLTETFNISLEPKIPNQLYICQPIASPKSSTISFWNAVIVV